MPRVKHLQHPNRIQELRERAELSRTKLAAEFDVDTTTLYRWERGGPVPDKVIPLLARRLGADPSYMMAWEEAA